MSPVAVRQAPGVGHRGARAGRRMRGAMALAAAAALALPGTARAANRTFAINSLIIPVQIEYQEDDAVIDAYGLVYSVLRRNPEQIAAGKKYITFYWAIAPNKLSQYRCNTNTNTLPSYGGLNDNDGCDFAIQAASGRPVALLLPDNVNERSPFGTQADEYVYKSAYTAAGGPARGNTTQVGNSRTVMKYLGGAFVVDAADRSAFIEMLGNPAYPELAQYRDTLSGNYVRIHSAKTSFTAPVARILNAKPPRIAVVNTAASTFLTDVLAQAGLDQIANWNAPAPNGEVYELLDPALVLTGTATDPRGLLNDGRYGLVWIPDGGIAVGPGEMANLSYFVDQGYGAYVEANSIESVENGGTPYHTTSGVSVLNPNIAYYDDCNDRLLPAGSFYRSTRTGDCFEYGGMRQPYAQTGNFAFEGGQGNYKAFTPLGAFLPAVNQVLKLGTQTLTSARFKDNDLSKGLVFYMAGHKFANARYWGQRLIMDSVISNVPLAVPLELARSEPVGYTDTTVTPATNRVYQGTYVQLPDPVSRDIDIYNGNQPQRWQFPYTQGHLYEYNLTSISTATAGQAFSANKNWDAAAQVPSPGSRTIFTALGGSAHLGWSMVNWWYDQVGSGCANQDASGVCLLSRALAACGTAGVTGDVLLPASDATATADLQRSRLGMFVQQVRGYCSSHTPPITGIPNFTPGNNQCDDNRQSNTAKLGGVDHSSPAVVGPSRYVTGPPWDTRPVVAYVGARDGMLHAIYVSGSRNNWTADGRTLGNVAPGTELWAFIPPGQICGASGQSGLFSNDAQVDASVNVIDVYGNFPSDKNNDGVIDWTPNPDPAFDERPTGIKTWRTVLLGAVGQGGSELFALDVTNPLKPVLLWHVAGATERDDRWDADGNGSFADVGDHMDPANPRTYALQWLDTADASGLSALNGVSVAKTGRYDYRNLGLTYGTAVGKLWEGGGFTYVAYVATSTADFSNPDTPLGFKGIEVFAIDLVTGQKVWQWQRRYARATIDGVVVADNTIPGRPALSDVDADGSVDRIYVGDIEGHLWELEAHRGGNMNYLESSDSQAAPNQRFYSFPLFGTPSMVASGAPAASLDLVTLADGSLAQQPLTSPTGLGRFTQVPSTPPSLLTYIPYHLAVLQGSMGVDWDVANYEAGNLFVLPVYWELPARLGYWYTTGPQALLTVGGPGDPRAFGLVKPAAAWTIPLLLGERIFGMPRVVNNEIVFTTARGSFTGDISATITERGNLYIVKPAATTTESIGAKAFGGVLVFQNTLVTSTATGIKAKAQPTDMQGGGPAQRPFNRSTPVIFKAWEPPIDTARGQ